MCWKESLIGSSDSFTNLAYFSWFFSRNVLAISIKMNGYFGIFLYILIRTILGTILGTVLGTVLGTILGIIIGSSIGNFRDILGYKFEDNFNCSLKRMFENKQNIGCKFFFKYIHTSLYFQQWVLLLIDFWWTSQSQICW